MITSFNDSTACWFWIKRLFEWILTTSSHLFPLGYQQRGPYPFSIIQTINWFSFLQVSIFLWSPIWRLFCESSRQYENFSCHGAYSGRSLEGWKNQGKEFKLVVFNQKEQITWGSARIRLEWKQSTRPLADKTRTHLHSHIESSLISLTNGISSSSLSVSREAFSDCFTWPMK